jgi:hypothetical protein
VAGSDKSTGTGLPVQRGRCCPAVVQPSVLAGPATLPPAVVVQMVQHPLTDKGIEIFLRDAEKYTAV